jgi:hypothetical protein
MNKEAAIAASGGSIHEHRKATRKMRWWYESLADYMIANPTKTQNEIALHFGKAVSTISTIIHTDGFKSYMRQRRADMAENLDRSVRNKLTNVLDQTLDALTEKLTKKKDTLPVGDLKFIGDMALKGLGYGLEKPQVTVNMPAQQTTVVVPVSLQDLADAQQALRNSQRQMIDVTPPAPVTDDSSPLEGEAVGEQSD